MMKFRMSTLFSLTAFLSIAALGAIGCSGTGGTQGGDAGIKPRVTIKTSKDTATTDEKIDLTFSVRIGNQVAQQGETIHVTTTFGKFAEGSAIVDLIIDANGDATTSISSSDVGVATIEAAYKDSTAKATVEFKNATPVNPCSINLAPKGGKAEVEADGESSLVIDAVATGPDGKPVSVGTEIAFTTTDGSFDPTNPAMREYKTYVNNSEGKASATLVSTSQVKSVKVTASFTCSSMDAGGIRPSNFIMVEFVVPTAKPRIAVSADSYFVLANGTDKITITAEPKKENGETASAAEVPKIKFVATYGSFENGDYQIENPNVGGKATAVYSPGNAEGLPIITVSALIEERQTSARLSLKAIKSGTLTCENVSNKSIGLKNSGHVDNSTISFKAVDNDKNAVTNLPVTFTLSKSPGGVSIVPTNTKTDNNGSAQTLLYAGTVPTTVTVTASSKVGSAACPPIVLTTGVPNARYLNFSCDETTLNTGAMAEDYLEQACTVAIADRFSNKIPFATKLFFMTEAGAVTPSAETSEGDNAGLATVSVRSQNPRPKDVPPFSDEPRTGVGPKYNNPRDGLLTVIVATTGEEEFNDENGNGQYDTGEAFVDQGEPFVDFNDNNTWDIDEPFIDTNGNGKYDGPNGVWDGNTIIWKPTWLVWTGGLAKGGSCQTMSNSYSLLCPDKFDIPNGASMDFLLSIKDFNLLPLNPSATIAIKVDGPGKFIGKDDYKMLPSRGIGISMVRTQDPLNPKISYDTYKFGSYTSGFNATFTLADDDPEDNVPIPVYISADAQYSYNPKSSTTDITSSVYATGTMNSNQSSGSCGVDISYTPTLPVPADGVSAVTLQASTRGFNGQPMPDNTNVMFTTDAGLFTGSGSRLIVIPTVNGKATTQLTNNERGGNVKVAVEFTCDNGRKVTGEKNLVFMPVLLSMESDGGKVTLKADGTDYARLKALVTDTSKVPVTDGTVIRFTTTLGKFKQSTSNCVNTTIDSQICDVKTVSGYAIADLVGGYTTGEAKAAATLFGSDPTNSAEVVLRVIQIGQIQYLGVSRQPLGAKGSGYQETTDIRFKVTDNSGALLPGQQISFTVNGPQNDPSAATIDTATATTGADGIVYKDPVAKTLPIVSSGTLAGTISVTAKGVMGSQVVTASSDTITVVGAKTNHKSFSLSCTPKNVGGFGSSALEVKCKVGALDRFGNPVVVTQPVMFMTEAGTVPSVGNLVNGAFEIAVNTNQVKLPADVPPISGEPSYTTPDSKVHNPRDGLVTIIAAIKGEEEFDDLNGNGARDSGEPFLDQGEPFVDENDSDTYDVGEYFIDVNNNGQWDGPNGRWDSDTTIWRGTRILWSGAMIKGGDCSKVTPPHLSIICPPNASIADAGSLKISYEIKDGNLNLLTSSAKVAITAPPDVSLIGKLAFNLEDKLGMDFKNGRARELTNCIEGCQPPPGKCPCYTESTTISSFTSGYQGTFDMVDANAGDSGDIKKMDVIVSVNYDYNPSASNPAFQETLMGQYTINDPNAAGPCSFLFNAPQTAVADGVSSVNVNILSVTDQANAAVPDNTPITLTTDKGKFSNNRTEIAVLTKKDTVTGNANASAVLMVGSEPGVANLTASYTCGSISVKRYAQILLLDQSQVGKPSISVFSALPKLLTDGTSKVAINAFVYQANGNPVPDGTSVGFTTTRSTLTAPTAFTTGGKATVYLNAGNAPGIAIITASYQPPTGDPITATTQVQLVSLGSIQFVKADPSILGVKNSGFNESSSIQFKVLDNLGQPFQAQYPVKFSVSTAPGGVYLLVTDGFTESDGVTSTVLVTGTVATTITVSAKATLGTTTLTGVSSSIPIIGAKPSAKYFQLNPPTAGDKIQTVANFDEAYIQQDYNFKAYLGDRYSNIIAKQTTVHFRSEAGTITPEALSVEAKATGVLRKMAPYPKDVAPYCLDQAGKYDENKCNNPTTPIPNAVYYEPWYRIQGDPLYDPKHFYNPRDGFVTVIAVTTGEEEFDDDDGNGDFSPSDAYRVPRDDLKTGNAKCTAQLGSGNEEVCSWMNFNSNTLACSGSWDYYNPLTFHKSESFVDLSEPFVDMNDNGVWDAGEPFFDTNQNGVWDSGNGLWDNNTNIWTEGYQLWTRSYNTPEWNQTGSCNLSSFVDNIQTGVYSRNWLCSDQAFTMQRGTPTDQLTFNGRFCDLNLNSFFSERIGGLSGLWTTAPGVKMLDAQGNVVTVPITQVSNSDPFPLESKDSVLIKWKKDWADPIKGYEEIWIGTDSSWDYCWANRDYKKTKSFIVKSGCQENTTQLVGVAPTSYTQQTSTFIRLDVVDSGSNVVKAIKQVTGTWIP